MYRFMQLVNRNYGVQLSGYADLHQWSINHLADFWQTLWQWADVSAAAQGQRVLVDGHQMPGARWFPEARLNYAENLLRYRDDQTALVFVDENLHRQSLTYQDLYQQVAQLASALRHAGIQPGDRVAGFMPNTIATVVAMLATASIGAVWSSCSQDFGVLGVLDRLSQIQPRILFTCNGYLYNGQPQVCLDKIARLAQRLSSLEKVIITPLLPATYGGDLRQLNQQIKQTDQQQSWPEVVWYDDFIDPTATDITFAQMRFADPLFIMYSSGTTGKPKCIVHSVGGTLLQHLKEHQLHTNIQRQDKVFYFTTCGWMMWNWLVSGLASGCTLILFEGAPFKSSTLLMDLVQQEKITVFGTSAKYLSHLQKMGARPSQTHDLSSLHTILSTGSPLSPESFDYVYEHIKADLMLASISGGTDIISCFVLGCPLLPVYRGQIQAPGLGMAMAIYNAAGAAVVDETNELVCTRPFPSMPIYFWGDETGQKYHKAYFAHYHNTWSQGDYAKLTPQGGFVIYGRSDAVLNPGGVRIGTAEIYNQVNALPQVQESLAIGQTWQQDVRIILFVVLQAEEQLDAALIAHIKHHIRQHTSPRHVPAKIIQVADIPRTVSGKIVELAVKNLVHNRPVTNQDSLANPEALAHFVDLPELQKE